MADEKRLIDANALITAIQGTASEVARIAPYDPEWFTRLAQRQFEIIGIIDEAKTVDAVEVVRCKDCKHCIYISYACGDVRCGKLHADYITEVSFCSYGERKDNERKAD